ncbi:MAG: arginine--tRNA ligase, partial [Patescibacteria group bacterium]
NYFSETSLYNGNLCKKVLGLMKKKKIVCERDGATWLMLTKIGESKDEVIIKSSGEYTYFWSDILYHYHKFFIRKSSAILIVSADHLDHTRRLRIVFEKIFGIKPNMFNFIVYQMVHLVKGDELIRMSKRRGTYITLDDLVSEVGLDSVKFFFLKYSADTTVEFDLELAKKQSEENPIWYLHYGYVRLKKIIEKATANSLTLGHRLSPHSSDESQPLVSAVSPNTEQCSVFGPSQKTKIYFSSLKMINYFQHRLRQVPSGQLFALLNNQNYLLLFRKIHQFPDLLSEIVKDLRPNLLPQYLSELAKMFHSFYEQEPILKQKFPKQTKFVSGLKLNKVQFQQEIKLLFVNYLMRVLELGFYLIGVEPKNEL